MAYDLIIRGGTLVDGSGLPGYRADVGISGGMITAIGDLKGQSAKDSIDADGHVVCPGLIDAHTHFDAQVFWDPIGTNVCWSGVTSIIMGNCSYTLAPCKEADKRRVFSNLERAEEIPPQVMEAGIPWSWESIPEHLDALERLPKGLNIGIHVGHSALRTYVMGERAFTDVATDDDLATMKQLVADGMRAGTLGFSTARSNSHRTAEGNPVASRVADWSEIEALVGVLADLKTGIFQISRGFGSNDPAERHAEQAQIRDIAINSKVPLTCGTSWYRRAKPDYWREQFDVVEAVTAAGGTMMVQGGSCWNGSLRSFETVTPYDKFPVWEDFRKLPLDEQAKGLRDPKMRARLLDVARNIKRSDHPGLPAFYLQEVDWNWIFPYENPMPPHRSIAEMAGERGVDPLDLFIDLALEQDLKAFFISPLFNESEDFIQALICHPNTGITFSDAGAHIASAVNPVQSYLLGYWVRERRAITMELAIRKMTFDLAVFWGLGKRGLLREGWHADVTIFDPKTVAPQKPYMAADLPAGGKRLVYKSDGFLATIVNGQVFMRNNEHTGALAGQVMRGGAA
jgi:N-acyl-D-aspartate/D-glutamate deacylase